MKENLKIEKELLFKNNIKDITSISLDNDYKITNKEINGNFIITGEYKIHEVSINREKFNFKIPFKYQLDNAFDETTAKVEITNFLYDYKKDVLIVNIEYTITASKKDVFIFDNDESLDEFLSSREVEVVDTRLDNIKRQIDENDENKENKNNEIDKTKENNSTDLDREQTKKQTINDLNINKKCDNNKNDNNSIKQENIENNPPTSNIINEYQENKSENLTDKNTNNENTLDYNDLTIKQDRLEPNEIINNIKTFQDDFITYKVYTIKQDETLESIVVKCHTTIDELKEYNDLNNLSINDKLIIPQYEK